MCSGLNLISGMYLWMIGCLMGAWIRKRYVTLFVINGAELCDWGGSLNLSKIVSNFWKVKFV